MKSQSLTIPACRTILRRGSGTRAPFLVIGGQFLCEWFDHGSDYPFDAPVFGGVWLFGHATRSWRNQATYAEEHRHDFARIAVVEERARIVGDLHDVVAHNLSEMPYKRTRRRQHWQSSPIGQVHRCARSATAPAMPSSTCASC